MNPKLSGAYFYLHPQSSTLRINGPHRVDFLQRQVTNDVKSLEAGQAILAVLTTPMARILDAFYLFLDPTSANADPASDPGEAIHALGLPDRAASTAAYLKNHIFFMDQVTVEDVSQEFHQADLCGPQASAVLARLGFSLPVQPGKLQQIEVAGSECRAFGHIRGGGLGTRMIFSARAAEALVEALAKAGAIRVDAESFDQRRVEAGIPGAGKELSEEFTPLEVGLEAAISGQKGCYTGQEVIARQITYDKVTRQLAGLRLEGQAQVGASVLANEKPAGVVTSTVVSDTLGPIALAVLRRPSHEPGTRLAVRGEAGDTPALVVPLPFENTFSIE